VTTRLLIFSDYVRGKRLNRGMFAESGKPDGTLASADGVVDILTQHTDIRWYTQYFHRPEHRIVRCCAL
jgi:hypothetical protein